MLHARQLLVTIYNIAFWLVVYFLYFATQAWAVVDLGEIGVGVEVNHWAASYIQAAKSAGLLSYLEGKKFAPNRPLTRAEAAEIVAKTNFSKKKLENLGIRDQ
ncbi:MAG: S-layer homology domain-containing protein [Candidatus Margulisiibacteriota bacterium]